MPLRAILNGNDILAPVLPEAEWESLCTTAREAGHPLVLPCCRTSGHCRVSKLGTRHFVHYRRAECSWPPETAEHLLAKDAIVRGCQAAGFTAKSEYSEGDWRADVLAIKGNARIALEVQWSSQTTEETQERQSRYHKSKVRGCWFFRKIPVTLQPQRETPAFVLRFDERTPFVGIGECSWPLEEFTAGLLTRKVQFRECLTALQCQKVRIAIAGMKCWKCARSSTIYRIHGGLRTGCGSEIPVEDPLWSDDKLEFMPAIHEAVTSQLLGGNFPKLGQIKPRFSRTIGRAYMSFGCAHCDAIFGDWYGPEVIHETMCEVSREIIEVDITLPRQCSAPVPHWCFADGSQHCESGTNETKVI